jgi:APA family basic amino acid/polyamine antiporter
MDNQNSPGIQRSIGLGTATSIVVANMIGAGIFTTTGIMAKYVPNAFWILACWVLGGLIALCGALSYAELSTRMPDEGGEYLYLNRLYHPLFGFLTGWTSLFVGFSAPIAASAIGATAYLYSGILPAEDIVLQKLGACLLILVFTVVHYSGIKTGSLVQNILTVLKIFIVCGLAFAGLLFGQGNFEYIVDSLSGPESSFAFGTAMMLVMFSYSGWNASAYIAGEIRDPRRNLPRSLLWGTTMVIIIYLALNIFILYVTPFEQIKTTITVFELAAFNAFGPDISQILATLSGIALLSSLSAFILIGPRVYYAMSRDGLFFNFAARVHPRHHVPGRSIILQGMIAMIMVVVGTFEQLLVYIGFALGIFPLMAVVGLFVARAKKIGEEKAVKTWGYPVIPLIFLVCSASLLIIAYINRPLESSAAVLTVLVGIPLFYLWRSKFQKIS